MNSLNNFILSLIIIQLTIFNAFSQEANLSNEYDVKYIIKTNASFERSGVSAYEPHENYQYVNNYGITVGRNISSKFWIEISPQYIKNKTTLGLDRFGSIQEYPLLTDNFRTTVTILKYLSSFYFKVGPYCDFLLDVRSGTNKDFTFDEYHINSFGYGLEAAVGVENKIYKLLGLFIELRYNQNINTSLYLKAKKSHEGKFTNYGFNMGISVHL
jgi:hypothetical protein